MAHLQCSPETYDRLQAELARLRLEEHPAREAAVASARADSLSSVENYAIIEAVAELERLESRITRLAAQLADAEIVTEGSCEAVSVGTVVELDVGGARWELLVGSIHERSTALDVVSPDSPLGAALLGSVPGTTVRWSAPAGEREATIVALRAS